MVYLYAVVEESIKSFWVGFVFCLFFLETGLLFLKLIMLRTQKRSTCLYLLNIMVKGKAFTAMPPPEY